MPHTHARARAHTPHTPHTHMSHTHTTHTYTHTHTHTHTYISHHTHTHTHIYQCIAPHSPNAIAEYTPRVGYTVAQTCNPRVYTTHALHCERPRALPMRVYLWVPRLWWISVEQVFVDVWEFLCVCDVCVM